MIRNWSPSLIESRLRRLAKIEEDSDTVWDLIGAKVEKSGEAPPQHDLVFTGFDLNHFRAIIAKGLLAGRAIDPSRKGANASNIWFKEGSPFYAGYPTFVMTKQRLRKLGGQAGVGLAGQPGVHRLGYETRPGGIPAREFAIGYSFRGGYIIPVYKPPTWGGKPMGAEITLSGLRS